MHTLFWAMSGHGTIRSYRHTDGWGVHTFRFVTDEGKTKLVKFRFRTLQGKASLLWEEAQVTAGLNADFHRQDLFESIEKGYYPEWIVSATGLLVERSLHANLSCQRSSRHRSWRKKISYALDSIFSTLPKLSPKIWYPSHPLAN